jgi:hypothetical protein
MTLSSLPAWWHLVRCADALSGLRWALAGFGAMSDMSPTWSEKPQAVREEEARV